MYCTKYSENLKYTKMFCATYKYQQSTKLIALKLLYEGNNLKAMWIGTINFLKWQVVQ